MEKLEFQPIAGEASRTYVFASGSVKIDGVSGLCVRPSGSHRLNTTSGKKYVVAAGWLAIEVDAADWSA